MTTFEIEARYGDLHEVYFITSPYETEALQEVTQWAHTDGMQSPTLRVVSRVPFKVSYRNGKV